MDYGNIKDLINTIVNTDIMTFELNYNGVDIKIDRNKNSNLGSSVNGGNVSNVNNETYVNAPQVTTQKKEEPKLDMDRIAVDTSAKPTKVGNEVTSPIVGTFYAASSPEAEPFVKVGSKVKKGDVLFIIEAMKVINEIVSEYDGEVLEILGTDGELVEYGQPLVIIG